MLLLGSADHAADPVGHLNIQLTRHATGATPAGMLDDRADRTRDRLADRAGAELAIRE